MKLSLSALLIFFVVFGTKLLAQPVDKINNILLSRPWPAKWISHPDAGPSEYGIYLFRKDFTLDTKPGKFIVHVSADNRYKLYVNGVYVCNGPARGYLYKWNFESIDIAPYLKSGNNNVCALVWNFADHSPLAQILGQTGFIIQGDTDAEQIINSNTSWVVYIDPAYKPIPVNLNKYYVSGSGEEFTCAMHPWNWMDNNFDVTGWKKAREVETGKPTGCLGEWGGTSIHLLSPRAIPFMEEKPQRFARLYSTLTDQQVEKFLSQKAPLTIPANTHLKLLFDQQELTTAYPILNFSKGKNSVIKMTCSESLFDSTGNKGNRNAIENKHLYGNSDVIICDGGDNRQFQTLWWRTFRYIEFEIVTKDEPLILNDYSSIFTAYPFEEKASFACDKPEINQIWKVGWHTQRLCANETFFDCPYYEQLQYIGDARIQAMVSAYVSGDFRLIRNAIATTHDSQLPMGITQSRFPCKQTQIIPTFSLVWVTMVYDYWMLSDDTAFVKSMIPGMMETLNWFGNRVGENGLMGPVEWWSFVDWVKSDGWDNGNPPAAHSGNSAILSLQYAYTLQKASEVFDAYRFHNQATECRTLAEKINKAVYQNCYDVDRKLIADSPAKKTFSQHANILGILTNAFPESTNKTELVDRILTDKNLAQATLYYRFYLFEAFEKAGETGRFTSSLTPWVDMIHSGLTTFAETPDPARSDCHGWSASPVYYFLSLVSGIKPAEPGFKTVIIEPHPGDLKSIDAVYPHKLGNIQVHLQKDNSGHLSATIILPNQLKGIFKGNGGQMQLHEGTNVIK